MKKAGMKKTLLVVLLCGTLMWSACSTDWIGQAEEIVTALIPAASNIVALVAALEGKSVSAADMQTIQNAGSTSRSGSAAYPVADCGSIRRRMTRRSQGS